MDDLKQDASKWDHASISTGVAVVLRNDGISMLGVLEHDTDPYRLPYAGRHQAMPSLRSCMCVCDMDICL